MATPRNLCSGVFQIDLRDLRLWYNLFLFDNDKSLNVDICKKNNLDHSRKLKYHIWIYYVSKNFTVQKNFKKV